MACSQVAGLRLPVCRHLVRYRVKCFDGICRFANLLQSACRLMRKGRPSGRPLLHLVLSRGQRYNAAQRHSLAS